jgi:ABC-type multidrug transport system fused ATPase/permease subunit
MWPTSNAFDAVGTLQYLWPFLTLQRRPLFYLVAVALGLTAVEVLTPLLIGQVVDSLVGELAGRAEPIWLEHRGFTRGHVLSLLLVGALLRGVLLARRRALAGQVGEGVAARIRNTLWAHLQRLPLEETRRRGAGRLLLRFTGDTRAIQRLVTYGLAQLSQDLLIAAAVMLVLLVINLRMGLAVALLVPAYAVIFWRLNPELQETSRLARRRRSNISAFLNERIECMATVKAFVRHRHETARLAQLTDSLARWGSRLAAAGGRLQGLSAATVAAGMTLVLALAADEVAASRLTIGTLVASVTLVGLLSRIFHRVANVNRYLQEASISVENLAELLDARPESKGTVSSSRLRARAGRVKLDNVSCGFGDGRPALEKVSLRARRGELVAIAGSTGAGRSTLLSLVPRFLRPTAGRVTIDGRDVSDVSPASLRAQVGLVPDDAPIFEATIAENVGYGVRGRGVDREARIQCAARLAGVDRIVARLPSGWDTMLGGRGRELSRGERQRVALARALAADPPILLLDDVAAGLDAETEQELAALLRGLAREKTVIAATRSLPILSIADRIYVLENGRVVEKGTHTSLLRSGGRYQALIDARSGCLCVERSPEDAPSGASAGQEKSRGGRKGELNRPPAAAPQGEVADPIHRGLKSRLAGKPVGGEREADTPLAVFQSSASRGD